MTIDAFETFHKVQFFSLQLLLFDYLISKYGPKKKSEEFIYV